VIAGSAVAALAAFAEWEEWVNLIAGWWVAVAPWLIGFSDHSAAAKLHLIVSILVTVIAAVHLWLMRQSPPRVTA
jgi:hypothetical protein